MLVVVLTALALLAGLYLLWELRNIVVWCVVAVFLAVALNPAVDWLDRRGLPRVVAIVLVYLALLLLVVGLFTSPLTAVVFIAYFVVYQQVENHVLQPLVYSRSVHLHPIVVFLVAVAGAELLGILGALLAIPVAEILRILAAEWFAARTARTGEHAPAAEPVEIHE